MNKELRPPIDMKDLAHVIRTPLTVIKTQLAVSLAGSKNNPELKAVSITVNEQVELVATILSDLQLIAQADAGQIVAGQDRVDLAVISEELVAHCKDSESYVGIDFQISKSEEGSEVIASYEHMKIMISRLIYLATLDGATKVGLTLGKNQICVEDDGLGTEIDQAEAQGKTPRYSRRSSIGLSVVRIISAMYGYRLTADVRPGGSRIVLKRHVEQ